MASVSGVRMLHCRGLTSSRHVRQEIRYRMKETRPSKITFPLSSIPPFSSAKKVCGLPVLRFQHRSSLHTRSGVYPRNLGITSSTKPSYFKNRTLDGFQQQQEYLLPQSQHQLQQVRHHGGNKPSPSAPRVTLHFHDPKKPKDAQTITVEAAVGQTLLQVAHQHEIDLEGACEGVCACSTCHVILPRNIFNNLEEATEEEEDMLDMAFGLTDTSRLGCQVEVTHDMDGIEIELPEATRNFYVDGHVPKPH